MRAVVLISTVAISVAIGRRDVDRRAPKVDIWDIMERMENATIENPNTSNWSNVHDQVGFMDYDQYRRPYVMCAIGESAFQICMLHEPYRTKGLACMASWPDGAGKVNLGCYSMPMHALHMCDPYRCRSQPNNYGFNFCCCFGHFCNREYTAVNAINEPEP